ncbi:MAG: TonB-dependent receptor, partial [bacterium]|nr:TonB-dependent receptor [bacterium]
MKRTTVLSIIALFITVFLSSISTSQTIKTIKENTRSLEKTISVNLNNVSLEKALDVISEKALTKFSYIKDRLPLEKAVTVNMENVTALEVLMKILNDTETGLKVTDEGHNLIVPAEGVFGEIRGVVKDKDTEEPLIGANIVIPGTFLGASTDEQGRFRIQRLSPGEYILEASYVGYENERLDRIVLSQADTMEVNFELNIKVTSLREIIVTPGHFSMMENQSTTVNALEAEDIKNFPQLGEDIYRAVKRLPGLSGSDFAAKFAVRGGDQEEVLVLMDGMELYEPFHLKDIGGGTTSIIDVEAINGIDMMTGAFPAEFGNRLSGVFNMKTGVKTLDRPRISTALSFMNARFISEGSYADGRGYWQVLGRRGYLDLILDLVGEAQNFKPVYYDVLMKTQYFLNENNSISAHVLASDDKVTNFEEDTGEHLKASYGNSYGWLKWESQVNSRLFGRTVLSVGEVNQKRFADDRNGDSLEQLYFEATNNSGFNFYGLKQDWSFEFSDNSFMKFGFDTKRLSADYNYDRSFYQYWLPENTPFNVENIVKEQKGTELGLYFSNKFRISSALTAETGLRYDHASWTNDDNISPRLNLVYNFRKNTALRAGWGKFYQTMGINKLNVMDGDDIYYPAELSEHIVAGLEHGLDNGIDFRVEFYVKSLSRIRPKYYIVNSVDLTPETTRFRDRLEPESGESSGFEIYVRKDNGGKHSWWINYSNSDVHDIIDGIKTPRNLDQTHTVNLDYNYRPNSDWAFNVSWNYHSGWPHTIAEVSFTDAPGGGYYWDWSYDKLNRGRFPAYHRMDARISRIFNTSAGRLSTFIEVRNLYNRENIRKYDYDVLQMNAPYSYVLDRESEYWMPLI